jgi:hypothetical protein
LILPTRRDLEPKITRTEGSIRRGEKSYAIMKLMYDKLDSSEVEKIVTKFDISRFTKEMEPTGQYERQLRRLRA